MKLISALATTLATFSTLSIAQTERDLDSHEHGAASLNLAIDGSSVFLELDTPWNNVVGFEHAPRTDDQHTLIDNALALVNQPDQLFSFVGSDCVMTETSIESGIEDEEGHEGEHDGHEDGHKDDHDEKHDDEHKEDHDEKHDDGHKEDHDEKHDDEHKEDHDEKHEDGHKDDHDEKHDDGHKEDHDEDHDDGHKEDHDDDHKEGHDHEAHGDEGETHSSLLVGYTFECDNAAKLTAVDVTLLEIWPGFEDLDVQLIGPGGQGLVELNQQERLIDLTPIQ